MFLFWAHSEVSPSGVCVHVRNKRKEWGHRLLAQRLTTQGLLEYKQPLSEPCVECSVLHYNESKREWGCGGGRGARDVRGPDWLAGKSFTSDDTRSTQCVLNFRNSFLWLNTLHLCAIFRLSIICPLHASRNWKYIQIPASFIVCRKTIVEQEVSDMHPDVWHTCYDMR